MAWIPPKTNWPVEDVPGVGDFERIEGNIDELATHRLMGKKIVLIASGTRTISKSDSQPIKILLNNARDDDFLLVSTRFDWEIHYDIFYGYVLHLRLPPELPPLVSGMTASYQVIALRVA